MTEQEFLKRMDRHLERIDRHLERMDSHLEVSNRHMARGDDLYERILVLHEDTREFIREMTLRAERFTNRVAERLDRQTEEIRATTLRLEDLHQEAIAHRKSLWRVHDRLEDLRPGPEAA